MATETGPFAPASRARRTAQNASDSKAKPRKAATPVRRSGTAPLNYEPDLALTPKSARKAGKGTKKTSKRTKKTSKRTKTSIEAINKKTEAAVAKKQKAARKVRVEKELKSVAKEINARLDRAKVALDKADDLRLGAAIFLNQAKQTCEDGGVNFRTWVADNVLHAYNTVRQLAAIGGSEDPKQALADLRAGTKKAVEKSRAKAVAISTSASASPTPKAPIGTDAMQAAFGMLKPSDKMKFLKWATLEVGGTFTSSLTDTSPDRKVA